jgi:hypothetical protein
MFDEGDALGIRRMDQLDPQIAQVSQDLDGQGCRSAQANLLK